MRKPELARWIPPPLKVKVEITTRCNLRCPQCKRTQYRPKTRDMDMSTFSRIREQLLPEAKSLFFSGLGEPTLHPRFEEICAEVGRAKLRNPLLYAFFVTNGTNLGREVRSQLLKAGFDEILVSLDATTKGTYERVRPGGDFHTVLENIRRLVAERNTVGASLRLTLTYTLNRLNAYEGRALPRIAAELSCDGIVLQNMMVYRRDAVKELLIGSGSSGFTIAEETIRIVAQDAVGMGIMCKIPAPGWTSAVRMAESGTGPQAPSGPPARCSRPWKVLQLRLNGSMSSCIGTEFLRVNMADVVDLQGEIWRSVPFNDVRRNIMAGEPDPRCSRCSVLNQIPMIDARRWLAGRP